jgi:hypothetical protein
MEEDDAGDEMSMSRGENDYMEYSIHLSGSSINSS